MVYLKGCEEYSNKLDNYLNCVKQSFSLTNSEDLVISEVSKRAFMSDLICIFNTVEEYFMFVLKNYTMYICENPSKENTDVYGDSGYINENLVDKSHKFKAFISSYEKNYVKLNHRDMVLLYKESLPYIEKQIKMINKKCFK